MVQLTIANCGGRWNDTLSGAITSVALLLSIHLH